MKEDRMSTRATATVEHTGWEEISIEGSGSGEAADAPKLSRAIVTNVFKGDFEATSRSELLMCGRTDGTGGYTAQERIEGSIGGRSGSFTLHHGATRVGTGETRFGYIVPGSGTGDLRGITGQATYHQDGQSATLTLDYDLG
jgi:hypothetical protein